VAETTAPDCNGVGVGDNPATWVCGVRPHQE